MPDINPAIQSELDLITAAIKANTTPESIYLFGSYANGVPNSDSDIDIYVVVPDIDKFFTLLDWDIANNQGFSESYREVVREDKVKIDGSKKSTRFCYRIYALSAREWKSPQMMCFCLKNILGNSQKNLLKDA